MTKNHDFLKTLQIGGEDPQWRARGATRAFWRASLAGSNPLPLKLPWEAILKGLFLNKND